MYVFISELSFETYLYQNFCYSKLDEKTNILLSNFQRFLKAT